MSGKRSVRSDHLITDSNGWVRMITSGKARAKEGLDLLRVAVNEMHRDELPRSDRPCHELRPARVDEPGERDERKIDARLRQTSVLEGSENRLGNEHIAGVKIPFITGLDQEAQIGYIGRGIERRELDVTESRRKLPPDLHANACHPLPDPVVTGVGLCERIDRICLRDQYARRV